MSFTDNSTGILGLTISGEGIRLHLGRGVILVGMYVALKKMRYSKIGNNW